MFRVVYFSAFDQLQWVCEETRTGRSLLFEDDGYREVKMEESAAIFRYVSPTVCRAYHCVKCCRRRSNCKIIKTNRSSSCIATDLSARKGIGKSILRFLFFALSPLETSVAQALSPHFHFGHRNTAMKYKRGPVSIVA